MAPPTLTSLKRDKRAIKRIVISLKEQFDDIVSLEEDDYLLEAELKLEEMQEEVSQYRELQRQTLALLQATETESLEELEIQHSEESVEVSSILSQSNCSSVAIRINITSLPLVTRY